MKIAFNISKMVLAIGLMALLSLGCDVGAGEDNLNDTSSPVNDRDGDFWSDSIDCDPDDPAIFNNPDGSCDGVGEPVDTATETDSATELDTSSDTDTDTDTDTQTS